MSGKSVVRRIALAVAALLVVVLVVGTITVVTLVRRPLPATSGEFQIDGLTGEVEVIRDERGVPQIYADNPIDLFMAQGYVHAQDRFFEMDYRRHLTAGRLSELVGGNESAIEADSTIRTFGWRRVAEQEWELLSPASREYLQAYADGVNAYLSDRQPNSLGLEYTVLGLTVEVGDIEPWDPIDSLAWIKAMAWDLLGNYSDELERAAVYGQVGDLDMVEAIFPDYPAVQNLPIVPTAALLDAHETAAAAEAAAGGSVDVSGGSDAQAGAAPAEGLAPASAAPAGAAPATNAGAPSAAPAAAGSAYADALAALHAVPELVGEGDGIGSNSWVISGEHTASGAPLLANDPHLGDSAPGVWYQVGLHCRTVSAECGFDVAGYSFAGLPGVVIGHNADLAWGLTNMGSDSSDFFLERVFPDGTYLYEGERRPLVERREEIAVNGGENISITVLSTPHGPLVSEVMPSVRAAGDAPVPEGSPPTGLSGYAVALSWTALTPGRTGDAIFALNLARNAEDIAAAATLFEVPTQNIVFATTAGDIGYQAPGMVPIRANVPDAVVPSDGRWPRPGWDARYDWQGFVDPAQMPAALNPDEGFIVAANQAVQAPGDGPFLTLDPDYGYRSQRIRDRITAQIAEGEPFTSADMTEIQLDDANPFAELLVPVLQDIDVPDDDGNADEFVQEAVDLFDEWDMHNDPDSAAAAYFSAVWANLLKLTFWDQMPESMQPTGGSRWLEAVQLLLANEESPWWDDRATLTSVETRDGILSQALRDARLQLTVSLGKDPSEWQWGRLHVAAPEHPVLGGEGVPGIVRNFVNPDPIGVGGGSSIVDARGWDASNWVDGYPNFTVTAVPSMRMVVDLADLDASTWVNFSGASGHPASNHYDDQFGPWAAGETFAWPYSRAAVEAAEADTMTLTPAGG